MYFIVGEIIQKLNRNNLDSKPLADFPLLLQNIVELDSNLERWRADLLESLHYEHIPDMPSADGGPTGRMNELLHMMYLSLRIPIHRPVLRRSLERLSSGSATAAVIRNFSDMLEEPSIAVLPRIAIEVIDIVDQASGPANLLAAWWPALYYSKRTTCAELRLVTNKHSFQCRLDNICLFPPAPVTPGLRTQGSS
jgi:hypothetical protein